ncbi:ATP-binding protein [Streptomyces sp. NPDC048650]|uniref:ATP-binding protein n=1 Tax=Streptomyces sp. NPDC048650 TaxID=3365583 RepID=UPI003717D1A0
MDPNPNRGPEEYREQGHPAGAPTPPSGAEQAGSGGQARVVRLVSGGYLVTVNPVDGSEIEPCPPGERPAVPGKLRADERAGAARAAAAPLPIGPPGSAGHETLLEERSEETERLVRLLSRGRSVRLTGPSGSGRTRLLDAVATACADLAPDGVIRLSGYHRTATDVMYALFGAVYRAPRHRPDRPELLRRLGGIGAIVVLDDLEFGGTALDELLDATPECAFLTAATPDVPAPSPDSHLEEVFLGGVGRGACARMLERAVDRKLTADEESWAADLWFESEGLPLRFVQAGALLRRRDRVQAEAAAAAPDTADAGEGAAAGSDAHPDGPLPTLGEAASPVPLLAARMGAAAQETLRFAVALGGELPHQAHLPALTEDTHADAVLGELLGSGLITPAGSCYRLAATVQEQLAALGYAEGAAARVHTAAQHYAWWAGHPSVAPERAAAEADAVLAAMGVLTGSRESGHASAAVLLARTAAPAFAAALHWSAWERSLRHGQEAARLAGEVAEEAYFHHELGVLALCSGSLDRARAELEASIGLRGVLSDRRGAVAGRRALALVTDRSRADSAAADTTVLHPAGPKADAKGPQGRPDTAASSGAAATARLRLQAADGTAATVVARGSASAAATTALPATAGATGRRAVRRNAVAAGAGALLVAVLGTVVTLGMTADDDSKSGDHVTSEQTTPDGENPELPTEPPGSGSSLPPSTADKATPAGAGRHDGTSPSASAPSTGQAPTDPSTRPSQPTARPTRPTGGPGTPTDGPTRPTHPPTGSPTSPTPTEDPTGEPTDPSPTGPTGKPTTQSPSQSVTSTSGSPSEASPQSASGTAPQPSASDAGTPSDSGSAPAG